ncbi:MAG TPA: serine/threonine-protein kinase [Chthoniobacterales bacterium]|nr:serine/threonine-protein kinase [Chthoniobacterales bacterium]
MDSSSPGELDLGHTVRGFRPGQKVFRRYSLVRILGRGGMGVVWLARDEELEREVALKFLPELVLHDRALLDNLKAETRRSLELTHRHIVRIYDFVQDQDGACISMEYIDGQTLSQMRAHQANLILEAAVLQRYVAELCEALEYAHNRAKIVHRDIKPSNLMVNSRDEMKIADFGIARSLTDSVSILSKTQQTSGTLVYMSPQQLDGERTSPLDDVYSVGAVLYELLTSKPPFYRGQIDHQIRTKPPVSIAERRSELGIEAGPVPLTWEQTIAACLAKNPADRPQSAQEIVRAISGENLPPPNAPAIQPVAHYESSPVTAETFAGSVSASSRPGIRSIPSLDRKKIGYILACLGIVILPVLALLYFSGAITDQTREASRLDQPTASPASPQVETGRVVVNTVPANVSVYLDGSDRGRTPLVIDSVTPGIHHVSIEASGYIGSSLIADVKAGGSFDFGTIHLVAVPAPAPAPSPASTEAPRSYPPPLSSLPPSFPTRDLRAEIEKFVYEHLRKSVNADISGMIADYADRVDYYENGLVDRSFIVKDRQTYTAGWPFVQIVPRGGVRISETNSDRVTIWFDYRFDARNRKGIHSLGDTANIWVLDTSDGGLKIVSEKQTVTNRKRTR